MAQESAAGDLVQLADALLEKVQALTRVEETARGRNAALNLIDVRMLQDRLAIISRNLLLITNTSRPGTINRLPTNVVVQIFSHLQRLPLQSSRSYFPPLFLKWIAITHVCTYWRDTALSTPSLWTNIYLHAKGGIPLVDAFITRSHERHLTLYMGRGPWRTDSIGQIQAWSRVLRRAISTAGTRVDRIILEPGFPIDDILRADQMSQKLGEGLFKAVASFSSARPLDAPNPLTTSTDETITGFLTCSIPGIRHLDLSSCPIHYILRRHEPFKHLTTLRLVQACDEKHTVPGSQLPVGFDDIIRVVTASRKSLRHLTLVGLPFCTGTAPPMDGAPITLEALESIELGDWPSNNVLAAFTHRIEVPHTASRCIWGTGLQDPTSLTLYPFLQCANQGKRPDSNAQSGDASHPKTIIVRIFLGSVPGGDMLTYKNGTLYINGDIPFSLYSTLFVDPLKQPLASVTDLVLTSLTTPITVPEWASVFESLPGIVNLKVRDAEASRLLRALKLTPSALPCLANIDIQYSEQVYGSSKGNLDPLDVQYSTEPLSLTTLLLAVVLQRTSDADAEASRTQHSHGVREGLLKRVFLRLGSRGKWLDWDVDVDNVFKRMARFKGMRATCLSKPNSMIEDSERVREEQDRWYLTMKEMDGVWPTKAVYFTRMLDTSGSSS
ncbi:hypothetical protein D9611_012119 [Ephemerocybe angulata]|uniref:F-box domain-containing protein n=1 Tax=Ephemerocybe angulata TaxID=980116 RepID=A0A8H5C5M5_9AGAR|nr:hypothetical protein D9611_012119 [Tulosesus angulatus]